MASQDPDQPRPKKVPGVPRYDDRPEATGQESEDSPKKEPKKGKGTTPKLAPGLPDYGDVEPGDPRRIDIEGT